MVNLNSKKDRKNFFSNMALVLVLVILLFLIMGIGREYVKQRSLNSEIAGLEQELEKLNLNKKIFLSSIEEYQSDSFLEQEARAKFNLKKPGEKVAVIPVPNMDDSLLTEKDEKRAQELRGARFENIFAWWQYFFGA